MYVSLGIVLISSLGVWYLFKLKAKKSHKTLKVFYVLYSVKKQLWGKVMLWSILRYVVFSSQYVLLIWVFTGQSDWLNMYSGVAVIFLIQSVLPGFILADFIVAD